MSTPTLLHIEDSTADARLVGHLLEDANASWSRQHADTLEAGLSALGEQRFDVVLLDLFLPDNMGPDTLDQVRQVAPDTPIVVLTALEDPELSGQALRHGASAVLFKGQTSPAELADALAQAARTPSGAGEELAAPTMASDTPVRRVLEQGLRAPLEAVLDAWDPAALNDLEARGAGALAGDPCKRLEATGRMLSHVTDLLHDTAALLSSPSGHPHDHQTEAGTVLDDVLALRGNALLAHDVTVTRGPLPTVALPRDHLEQIFDRILSIGLRSDQPARLHVTGTVVNDRTELAVEDRGGWTTCRDLTRALDPATSDKVTHLETLLDAQLLKQLVTGAGGRIRSPGSALGPQHGIGITLPPGTAQPESHGALSNRPAAAQQPGS